MPIYLRKIIIVLVVPSMLLLMSALLLALMLDLRQPPALVGEAAGADASTDASPTDLYADRVIAQVQERLRHQPAHPRLLTQLAGAYLQKAREHANPVYYDRADAALQQALALQPEDADALVVRGSLLLARHLFAEALQVAQQVLAIDAYKVQAYGIAGDALIELGRYDEAVAMVQQMVDRRPDLSAYSRVAYVRELHGDLAGAIDAMRLAVKAGAPAMENTNWCRVQLGQLYFTAGDLIAAKYWFLQALETAPRYVPALHGLAQVLAAKGEADAAITLLEELVARTPLPESRCLLGDLYALRGDSLAAAQQYEYVLQFNHAHSHSGAPQMDVEVAYLLADRDIHLDEALLCARQAMATRPSVTVQVMYAWVLYKNGEYQEAAKEVGQALRLGTQQPAWFYHAGMIHLAVGDTDAAIHYLRQALALNPQFSPRHGPHAQRVLRQLLVAGD